MPVGTGLPWILNISFLSFIAWKYDYILHVEFFAIFNWNVDIDIIIIHIPGTSDCETREFIDAEHIISGNTLVVEHSNVQKLLEYNSIHRWDVC